MRRMYIRVLWRLQWNFAVKLLILGLGRVFEPGDILSKSPSFINRLIVGDSYVVYQRNATDTGPSEISDFRFQISDCQLPIAD
jgi:hypothetical protein